ncbi:MAG: sigma-70 family RNA polymerase sigma factor [Myxococcaceae bacterium]|nr:sigma-70 family RNA polymerase sigma factor [Myxococcaceae bacterium]
MTDGADTLARVLAITAPDAAALLARIAEQWPAVHIDARGLAVFLDERRPPGAALGSLHVEDLALAWGCLAKQPSAQSTFVLAMRPGLRRVLSRAGSDCEDLEAQVMTRLLGHGGAAPALQRYAGLGKLQHFVMVAGMRSLLDWQRAVRRAPQPEDDPWLELAVDVASDERGPGERTEWARLRPHVRGALEAAIASLPVRQRNLLRLHYLEGLSADALGEMFGVHRATTTRWLADARTHVFGEVARHLRTTLDLGSATLDSVHRQLATGADLSLGGLLASEHER